MTRRKEAVLAALIGTPLLLGAIELGLWGAGVEPRPRLRVDTNTCYTELDPSARVYDAKQGLVHDLWLDANGFRVAAEVSRGAVEREPTRCRILALGDSFTEGLYVEPEEAWPARLEQTLRGRGYDVGVDNGGFRGRTIVAQRFAALTRWSPLRHDLVIVEHTANDLVELHEDSRAGCTEPRFDLLARLRLYRVAEDVAIRWQAYRKQRQSSGISEAECHASAATYRDLLVDTARRVRDDGRGFLFVRMHGFYCPALADRASFWNEYSADIKRRLAAIEVDVLDVHEELMKPNRDLRPADTHPNPAAYVAVAERIAAQIERSGVLDHCRKKIQAPVDFAAP